MTKKTRAALVALLLGFAAAASAAAAEPSSSRARIVPPVEREPAPLEPGMDVEKGPAGDAERFRLWTPLTEAELNAADPSFRHWVRLIHSGRADKRVMRLYWYHRFRLDPFDKLVPEGWRERGVAVLRDPVRTRKALEAWERRRVAAQASAGPPQRGGVPVPPEGSIEAAADRLRSEAAAREAAAAGISPYGVWVPIGPYTIPGRMTGLDRPEGQPLTLYAAAADGGVWRTTDGGATWETLTDFEKTLSGGAILLDPSNPSVIYFGTGEGNGAIDNYPGVGVLKSSDGGATWTESNRFSSAVRRLAMHRSEPSRIYAAGDSGCYLSTDAGATFSLISAPGLPTNAAASDVLVRPDNADWVYCAIWGGPDGGIYRSTDRGATWSLLTEGLPAKGSVGRIALAVSKSNPDVLIAGIDTAGGTVYKTVNGGDQWTRLDDSAGFCGGQCWYDIAVGIDAANPDVMFAGGIDTFRSTDGGATWTQVTSSAGGHGAPNYVHVDQHFIFTPVPGEVILANDGGIYRSTDSGASWVEWSQGMDTTQYYGICRHPSDAYWAFGGTQDNGSHRRRQADDPEWQQVLGGDGGMCMTGPPTTSIVVGEYQNTNIQRSTNGGDSFSNANGGIGPAEPHPWVGILVADPSNRNNMWTATNRIYRSLDARATNWVAVSGPLYFSLPVSAIEVAPTDSNVVYAGFDGGGLFVTGNALATPVSWTSIRSGAMPLRGVRRIRAHPTIPNTVYVVFSGYGSGKIWKSSDRGQTWANVTGDFPDVPVNDLVIDADSPGTLIAATDLGVFRSDDDSAHWYGWSTGLPTVSSIELTFDRDRDTLRLGTHGRSMWQWQEPSDTPTAVPDGSVVPGAMLRADRIGASTMRVRWDVRSCTARDYNLFYGDLAQVSSYTYTGAYCGLGTSGRADVPLPATASGNAFFLLASTDGAGNEGPHGFDEAGQPVPANGIGLCGIAAQQQAATCP